MFWLGFVIGSVSTALASAYIFTKVLIDNSKDM